MIFLNFYLELMVLEMDTDNFTWKLLNHHEALWKSHSLIPNTQIHIYASANCVPLSLDGRFDERDRDKP